VVQNRQGELLPSERRNVGWGSLTPKGNKSPPATNYTKKIIVVRGHKLKNRVKQTRNEPGVWQRAFQRHEM